MKKTLPSALTLVALIGFACPASAAPVLVNGSFEDTTGLADSGTFFDGVPIGWSFTGTGVQLLTSSIAIAPSGIDGNLYVESTGDDALSSFGTLSQSVTGLTVGQKYEVAFLWGNRGAPGDDAYDFAVEMGGATFSRAGSGLVNLTAGSIQFIASLSTEELKIIFNDPGAPTLTDGALDAFEIHAVSDVPEPSSMVLLSLGVAGLGARFGRKIRSS